jgi:hypothetical protein
VEIPTAQSNYNREGKEIAIHIINKTTSLTQNALHTGTLKLAGRRHVRVVERSVYRYLVPNRA